MPFLQVSNSGVTRSAWSVGRRTQDRACLLPLNIFHVLLGDPSPASEGAYLADCPRESMISAQRAATNGTQVVIFLFRKQEE